MPSSYSPNLRIELIASGEQANTWGNTTNVNLGTLIEQAICGYVSLNSMTDANYTLTALNGASDQARQMFVDVPAGTTLSATRFIIAPAVSKVYVVRNLTTGGQSVTIATATTGVTGVTIPNGRIKMVACDGTNFTEVTTSLSKLYLETAIDYATSAANQAVTKTYVDSGFLRLAGNNTVTGNTTFSGTVTLPSTTPTGYQATSYSYVNSNYLWKASGGPATQDVYPYLRLQYTPVNAADAVPKTYVDSNFVSLFNPQTIAGVKTFTSNMALSGAGVQLTLPNAPVSGTDAVNKSYVDGATSNFMTVSGAAQTNITSAKTFNNTVSIGSGYQLYLPSGDGTAGANYAINRGYVDYVISVLTPTVVTTDTTQSISGAKTFTTGVVLSGATTQLTLPNDPVASTDAARRGWIISNYVDINSTQNVTGIKTFPNGLSMGASGQIYLPSSPAGSLYAANQAYVDNEIAYLASQGVPNTRTISAGSTNVYINGVAGGSATLASNITIDVSSVTVPVTGVGGTSPVKANGVSGSYQTGNINISMDVASSSTNGYLSYTDWTTFKNKADANGSNASGTWGISISGSAGSASTVPWTVSYTHLTLPTNREV